MALRNTVDQTPALPAATCVLGMHRSGTSLLIRIVAALGLDLGDDAHLLPPTALNAAGFWEHRPIQTLNDELLARYGGTWYAPPELPPGWARDHALRELRERARRLIDAHFSGARQWAFKDPRTCLTFPFWREVSALRSVLCVRNPVEVAKSLEYALPFERSLALWLHYVEASLRHTAGEPRVIVFHDEVMADPVAVLRRIAEGLRMPPPVPEMTARVRAIVRADLRHHRCTTESLLSDSRVPFPVKALYATLRGVPGEGTTELLAAHARREVLSRWSPPSAARAGEPAHVRGRGAAGVVRSVMLAAGIPTIHRVLVVGASAPLLSADLAAAFEGAELNVIVEPTDDCARPPFDLVWWDAGTERRGRLRARQVLRSLVERLASRGLLVVTAAGRWANAALLPVMPAGRRSARQTSVARILEEMMQYADLRIVSVVERGWNNGTDVVAVVRTFATDRTSVAAVRASRGDLR